MARPFVQASSVRQNAEPSKLVVRTGNLLFRYRDFLFPFTFIALAFGTKPRLVAGDESLDHLIDVLGVSIALIGQLLRVVVIGYAYIRRGGKNKRIHADTLVQEGFFAHCRNPLYLGNILILFGLVVVHNSVWFYAIGLPFFLLSYLCLVVAEEDYLHGKFGNAYEDYCRRVPRFLPRFTGLRKSLEGMAFDWKKVVRKEYGSTFTWTTTVLALLIWEAASNYGYPARKPEIHLFAVLWIPVVVGYLTARILKKKKLLGEG